MTGSSKQRESQQKQPYQQQVAHVVNPAGTGTLVLLNIQKRTDGPEGCRISLVLFNKMPLRAPRKMYYFSLNATDEICIYCLAPVAGFCHCAGL